MAGVAGSGTNAGALLSRSSCALLQALGVYSTTSIITVAVGYGTLRAEWIQSMEVVLMDGSVIRTKGSNRARAVLLPGRASRRVLSSADTIERSAGKSTTGWDTGRLFLGSEGTLGVRPLHSHDIDAHLLTTLLLQIITELTVRLAPVVPLKVALTSFPTVQQAVSTVVSMLSSGLTPTSLELLDGTSIKGLNLAKLLPDALPEEPTVLMRFSNPSEAVNQASLETVKAIVQREGGRELRIAKDDQENEELWKARKVSSPLPVGYLASTLELRLTLPARCVSYSRNIGRSNCSSAKGAVLSYVLSSLPSLVPEPLLTLVDSSQITDVCVPISRLAEFVDRSEVLVHDSGCIAPIVAHIGDGNVHRAILWRGKEGETTRPREVETLAKKLVELALELEGTCAGEHGIGYVPSLAVIQADCAWTCHLPA